MFRNCRFTNNTNAFGNISTVSMTFESCYAANNTNLGLPQYSERFPAYIAALLPNKFDGTNPGYVDVVNHNFNLAANAEYRQIAHHVGTLLSPTEYAHLTAGLPVQSIGGGGVSKSRIIGGL
jgi:hypothetical protein